MREKHVAELRKELIHLQTQYSRPDAVVRFAPAGHICEVAFKSFHANNVTYAINSGKMPHIPRF